MILLNTIPESNVLVGLGLNRRILSMVNNSANQVKSLTGGSVEQSMTPGIRKPLGIRKPIKFM
jgi:hypothetical protein